MSLNRQVNLLLGRCISTLMEPLLVERRCELQLELLQTVQPPLEPRATERQARAAERRAEPQLPQRTQMIFGMRWSELEKKYDTTGFIDLL